MGCYNSIVIKAPADEVWEAIKNFHDMSWSEHVVTKVEKASDQSGEEIGAKRIVNEAFHETLLSIDHETKKVTYSINHGPGVLSKENVKGYVGELTVFPVSDDNTSFVLWTTDWESTVEGDVAEFCNPIYRGLAARYEKSFFLIFQTHIGSWENG